MALGVLPGSELKSMLQGVCEAMPADALKALLVAVGESLEAKQHKAILLYVAPSVASSLWKSGNASDAALKSSAKAFEEAIMIADNQTAQEEIINALSAQAIVDTVAKNGMNNLTTQAKRDGGFDWDKIGRDATSAAVSGLVPRRLAKTVVNRYLRDAEPNALKNIVYRGIRRIDTKVLARLAPRCLAAVVGAPPPTPPTDLLPREKEQTQRSWWSLWKSRRAADAKTFLKERTVSSRLDAVTAAWLAPRLVLAVSPAERREQLEAAIQSLSDRRARALLTTPAITKRWLELRTEETIAQANPSSFMEFDLGGDDFSFDPKESKDSTPVRLKKSSILPEKNNPFFQAASSIGRAMAGPSSLAVWCPPADVRQIDATPIEFSVTNTNATQKSESSPRVVEQRARSAVDEAVGRLPPALIAGQLRSLVESLPAEFVRDEAVGLVLALPPTDLVEAATSLVDAAPEQALRSLAAKLLDLAADMRKAPQGATTLHSLARAAEAADVELIRRAARTLLEGVAPRRLCAEVVRLLNLDGAPIRVKQAVINALVNAEQKSKQYENLRDMFQRNRDDVSDDTKKFDSIAVTKSQDARSEASKGSRDRAAAAMASLRRVLLEKSRVGALSDDDDDDDDNYYTHTFLAPRQDINKKNGLLFVPLNSASIFRQNAWTSKKNGQVIEPSGTPLESLLISTAQRLDPELVVEKALETLAALPAETYESLAKLVVSALWERVVLSALPTDLSRSVKTLVITALGEAPRDATLAASYVASATGGVAAGGAAKTAIGASAKVVGSTKGALALSSSHLWASPSSWPFIFSGIFASFKAGAISFIFSLKGLALASVATYAAKAFVAGTLEFEDNDWLRVFSETTVAAALLGIATISVSFLDDLQLSTTGNQGDNFFSSFSGNAEDRNVNQDQNSPDTLVRSLDDPRAALTAVFCGDDTHSVSDYELRELLLSLARKPPEREAAVACRDAIRDAVRRGALDFAINNATKENEDFAATYLAKLKLKAQRRQPWRTNQSTFKDNQSSERRRVRRRKAV
eukprot:CAMPEP_0197309580 /NCGR_PEP_ID=MMETSP0891-20130614/8157_1 /TAXON_ID=44058 ORGANISM="Aureoumbra lagunensis, Strain CCMP1510" /NCGR_SAMPLE_ID=MMETSP0891 /ASSEMBLY_ACC=CAM_ASM_000534 /LENGTH=1036 /DNA_ID=CAMNT_0042794721 /DNA_START=412 /DNA_END=3522 /DNA_ORIENTATION=+